LQLSLTDHYVREAACHPLNVGDKLAGRPGGITPAIAAVLAYIRGEGRPAGRPGGITPAIAGGLSQPLKLTPMGYILLLNQMSNPMTIASSITTPRMSCIIRLVRLMLAFILDDARGSNCMLQRAFSSW